MNRLAIMTDKALNKELDQIYAAMGRLRIQTHGDEIAELSIHADRIERELERRERLDDMRH